MTLTKEQMREYQRKRRAGCKPDVNPTNQDVNLVNRITLLEEVVAQLASKVDGLEKAQVKSVALGVSVKPKGDWNPYSKAAQASLKAMPYKERGVHEEGEDYN